MRLQRLNSARAGFTLLEALVSIVILGLIATVVSSLYVTGLQTSEALRDRVVLDSYLKSRMEKLISTNFDQLASGTENISAGGQNFTIDWTVTDADLDGDTFPEAGAKEIAVTLDDLSLSTIIVDTAGQVGKI